MKNKLIVILNNPYLELAARYFLAGLFLYACVHKIVQPSYLAKVIYGYKIMPGFTINIIAIILPFFELVCGLALLLGVFPRSAAIMINGMLMIFIVAITFNLLRGLQFDCGCFSFHKEGYFSDPRELLIRDIAYFLIGLVVIFCKERRKFCLKQTGGLLNNL